MTNNWFIVAMVVSIPLIGFFIVTKNNLSVLQYRESVYQPAPALVTITPNIPPVTQSEKDAIYNCQNDSDCTFVTSGCPCNGPRAMVNKKYVTQWQSQYPTQKACLSVACIEPQPVCLNNRCQL